jgi:protein tyrosine phosphatase (PTP) superfamily phosphohydrolase (DUF442 family)
MRKRRTGLRVQLTAAREAERVAVERAHRSARSGYWLAGFGYAMAVACALLAFVGCTLPFALEPGQLAINYIEISPRIGTSGMPTRAQFEPIANAGYQVVINLAPPDAMGSHADEAEIVAGHGMRYHNVPVNFARPTASDYVRFVDLMHQHRAERVLVHCQVNMRASSFVFLYRVLELGEDPDGAYDAVQRVWQPATQWRAFIKDMLANRGARLPMALDS